MSIARAVNGEVKKNEVDVKDMRLKCGRIWCTARANPSDFFCSDLFEYFSWGKNGKIL